MPSDTTIFLAAEELKLFGEATHALTRIADALELLLQGRRKLLAPSPAPDPSPAPETAGAPASPPPPRKPSPTKEELRAFLMTREKDAVRALFTELSATRFSEIPADRYPELMERAQALPPKEAA